MVVYVVSANLFMKYDHVTRHKS